MPDFKNEPYTDFSIAANRQSMEAALAKVRSEFGREYDLSIAGERLRTPDKLKSVNPSNPTEIVGIHQKATPAMASKAIEAAHSFFPEWSRTNPASRIAMLRRAAQSIRSRKMEFDAWLVYEAGKSWPEAEADVCEAIDFCEYYALEMERLSGPQPVSQLPGERDEMRYIPLGVGLIIPPWNFPLAIMAGMATAALVTGNTVVLKPSSETPTIAARFAEALLEAGFPERSFSLLTGSGSAIGDLLVQHPKTRFIAFTGSRDVGLRINELAAKHQPGQLWIKRVIAEKCSACSRAIVDERIYDDFLEKLRARVASIRVGPADDPSNYMGPVISDSARRSILDYIEVGKREGRLVAGGAAENGDGYFIQPTVIADVEPGAKIFQEEIFGPVLAVSKAKNFERALEMANDSQYGLTGAVYSNDPEHIRQARERFFVGNLYVNRKCTGAMVGAHPFGGFNLSGTDSKAGGPDYLLLFLQAKAIAEKIVN